MALWRLSSPPPGALGKLSQKCHEPATRPRAARSRIAMRNVWDAFNRFFGSAHNDKYAELLIQLAQTGVACSEHFRADRKSVV